MKSRTLIKCEHCNKGLLMARQGELFLKTSGISFPRCPYLNGIAMVVCMHCKAENLAPIGIFLP